MPIGVGIIGTTWGLNVQAPAFTAAGLEVVAVYSRDLKRGQELAAKLGIKHVFDSVEALCACPEVQIVSVASPAHLHSEHTLIALRAGKHVLMEKPGGANAAEVEAVVKEAQQRPNQIAIVDHEMRFSQGAMAARKAIQLDKAIGELRHFDMQTTMNLAGYGPTHVWKNELEKGGGVIGSIGVHCIDLLHFITGQKANGVQGLTQVYLKEKPSKEDQTKMLPCTAPEYVAVQLRCDGGAVGTLNLSGNMQGQSVNMIYFNGSNGSAKFDMTANVFTLLDAKGKVVLEVGKDEPLPEALGKRRGLLATFNLVTAMKEFLESGGQKKEGLGLASSLHDCLYNQQVIDAIHSSNTAGRQAKL